MADINRAVITGRLTKDPELRMTTTGKQVCSFTVACNRKKRKGEDEAQADFISCVAWDQSADYLNKYGHKGDLVQLEGQIQTRHYDDKDGKTVWVTEIKTDMVNLVPKGNRDTWTAEPAWKPEPEPTTYAKPVTASGTGPDSVPYQQMSIDGFARGMATESHRRNEIELPPADDDLPF